MGYVSDFAEEKREIVTLYSKKNRPIRKNPGFLSLIIPLLIIQYIRLLA